jgi:hypothetical protein
MFLTPFHLTELHIISGVSDFTENFERRVMTESAVVENFTRTRSRAIQDRADLADQKVSTRRRWRIPELAIGVVLMCGGALGAILLSRSGDSMVVVVGSAHNLERGVQITSQDLIALEVPSSFATSFVMGANAKSLIGQTMLINLNASSPITTAMLSPTVGLLPGEALTSSAIDIGKFPVDLAVGDSVRVVTVPDMAISESTEPSMFANEVIIYSITQTSDNNDVALVTFRSSLDLSMAIARAGEIYLVRVAGVDTRLSSGQP